MSLTHGETFPPDEREEISRYKLKREGSVERRDNGTRPGTQRKNYQSGDTGRVYWGGI